MEQQYLDLLQHILDHGKTRIDRTGTGVISIFDASMVFDLSTGQIPLLTTKKAGIKSIVHELLWFLEGSTDNNLLKERGCTIWNEWAAEDGDLGPIYGKQWVRWESYNKEDLQKAVRQVRSCLEDDSGFLSLGDALDDLSKLEDLINNPTEINQIQQLIDDLTYRPFSRRLIVSAWNAADAPSEYLQEIDSEDFANLETVSLSERLQYAYQSGELNHLKADEISEMKDTLISYDDVSAIHRVCRFLDKLNIPKEFVRTEPVMSPEFHSAYALLNDPRERLRIPKVIISSVSPQENIENGKAALASCHAMFQFYCEELTLEERQATLDDTNSIMGDMSMSALDALWVPRLRLSCKLTMRSV